MGENREGEKKFSAITKNISIHMVAYMSRTEETRGRRCRWERVKDSRTQFPKSPEIRAIGSI